MNPVCWFLRLFLRRFNPYRRRFVVYKYDPLLASLPVGEKSKEKP